MQLSFNRIWLLFKQQWVEQRQLYLFGTLAMIGIMAALFTFGITSNQFSSEVQFIEIIVGLFAFSVIFNTKLLSPINDKTKKTQLLLLPVSTTEKLVCTILFSIIFPVAYLIIIYPVVYLFHFLDTEILGSVNNFYILNWNDFDFYLVIGGYFLLQAFVILFSIIFVQYAFVKTVVLSFAVFFSVMLLGTDIIRSQIRKFVKTETSPIKKINITERYFDKKGNAYKIIRSKKKVSLKFESSNTHVMEGAFFSINNEENVRPYYKIRLEFYQDVIFKMIWLLAIPFLWLIIWFKLREAQV